MTKIIFFGAGDGACGVSCHAWVPDTGGPHGLRKDLGSNFYFWPQYIWPQMYQAIEHQMRPYMPREWISPSERILNNVNADKELKPGQGGAGQQG